MALATDVTNYGKPNKNHSRVDDLTGSGWYPVVRNHSQLLHAERPYDSTMTTIPGAFVLAVELLNCDFRHVSRIVDQISGLPRWGAGLELETARCVAMHRNTMQYAYALNMIVCMFMHSLIGL